MAALLPLLLGGLALGGINTAAFNIMASDTRKNIDKYKNTLDSNEYLNNQNVNQVITDLATYGYIDVDTYEKAIKLAKDYEDNRDSDKWYGFLDYTFSHLPGTNREAADLYDALAKGINKLTEDLDGRYEKFNPNELQEILSKPVYEVPGYSEIATVDANANELPVDPMYRYTNQELADLYGINYDTNYYYDLIKQGTQAEIDYSDFVNAQAWNAAQRDNTLRENNYLNTIRDAKAQAAIEGATLGAQAANELLANTAAANEYNTLLADTATTNLETIMPTYLADSNAKLDARQYHDMTLGKDIANVLESLYFNESNRYGADVERNANIYKANQSYNAAAAQANASMAAAKALGEADAYTKQNPYMWVFNRFYNAAKGTDKQKYFEALTNTQSYINNTETGFNNIADMLNAKK